LDQAGIFTSGISLASAPVFNSLFAWVLDDPHVTSGHGDRFDFKGENNTVYNLLSHANTTLNALFLHADYISTGSRQKLVHGSFMRAAFMTLLTNASRTIHLEYDAARPLSPKVSVDGAQISTGPQRKVDNVAIRFEGRTLTVSTPEWIMSVTSKVASGIIGAKTCATGRCILNVQLTPLFDADHATVAPHGLIGQSYDGDDVAILGKVDRYSLGETHTSAMGEGAIEGVAAQYKMTGTFATDFAFSRFGKTSALPRNSSLLTGVKMKRIKGAQSQTS